MATTQQSLTWTIVGQGAIGLLAACRLQIAGYKVKLWLRQPKPLKVHFQSETQEQLCHFQPASAPLSHLLIPVKAYAVHACLSELEAQLTAQSQLVISHNGMPNLASLSAYAQQAQGIWFLSTSHGALRTTDGVTHTGEGQSVLSPLNAAALAAKPSVLAALEAALGPITYTEDIRPYLWQKLAINAAINPLSALLNCRNGALAAPELSAQLQQIVAEVCQLAALEQIALPFALTWQKVQQVIAATANNYSSMQQDVAKGRPTELAAITGFIVETAAKHQLAVPANQALWQALTQG